MLRKFVSLTLALLLAHVCAAAVYARTTAAKEAERAAKVRQGVLKLGTGEGSLVKVRLRDGARVEGYVSAAGETSFTVTDAKSGVATLVPYQQVKQVRGNNLSTGAKIAIGVGVAVLIVALLWAAADKDFTN
jgi:hypothetical protein